MGKTFVVNSLEEMCDLMCGQIEEEEEETEDGGQEDIQTYSY